MKYLKWKKVTIHIYSKNDEKHRGMFLTKEIQVSEAMIIMQIALNFARGAFYL